MGGQKAVEAVTLLALAAVALWDGLRLRIQVGGSQTGAVEAGNYELLLGLLLATLVLLYWVREGGGATVDWGAEKGVGRVALGFGLVLVGVAAMPYLGYLLCTAFMFMAFLHCFSRYRWFTSLAVSTVAAAGSAWVWASVGLVLPQGIVPWP